MKSTYQILYKHTFLSYIDIKTKKKTKKSSAVSEWDILPVDYFEEIWPPGSYFLISCPAARLHHRTLLCIHSEQHSNYQAPAFVYLSGDFVILKFSRVTVHLGQWKTASTEFISKHVMLQKMRLHVANLVRLRVNWYCRISNKQATGIENNTPTQVRV